MTEKAPVEKPTAAFVLSLLAPTLWWPWFGLIAGIVVLIGAAMLYAKPEQRQTWGIVIIMASALNFFVGMGGLVAGALGVIGGALALSKGTV
jgi:hypothetical protein